MTSPLLFLVQNPYNSETREHLWSSVIVDCHDSFCGCTSPISHWLSIIFPEGHKDRYLTVNEIIHRELHNQQCLFGGEEGKKWWRGRRRQWYRPKRKYKRRRRPIYRRKYRRPPTRRRRRRKKVRRKLKNYLLKYGSQTALENVKLKD